MTKTTRQQLVEKTAELLETQGYHATGLNQIVKESCTPRGSLYYYFPDGKEELAAEAIETRGRAIQQNMVQQLAAYSDPAEAIYRLAMHLGEHMVESNGCGGAPFAATTLEAPTTSERLVHACRDAYRGMREAIAQKLRERAFSKERAEQLSTTVAAALDGAIILCRAEQSSEPMKQVAEELRMLLDCAASKKH